MGFYRVLGLGFIMEQKTETIKMHYLGTAVRIHSFMSSFEGLVIETLRIYHMGRFGKILRDTPTPSNLWLAATWVWGFLREL